MARARKSPASATEPRKKKPAAPGRKKGAKKGAAAPRWWLPPLVSLGIFAASFGVWMLIVPAARPKLMSFAAVADEAARKGVYLGLDVSDYPGTTVMRKLRQEAPYRWVGYYLKSPAHLDPSWMGTWKSALRDMGWSVAILYVGQQTSSLTEAQGRADADEAAREAEGEGFPPGAVIYLDVEANDEVGPQLGRYVRAFVAQLGEASGYRPGLYCHMKNASALAAVVEAEAKKRKVPFWVAGGDDFYFTSSPKSSSAPWATAWQGLLDVRDPARIVAAPVDVSTSITEKPSGF